MGNFALDDKQFYKFVILFVARLLILCPLFSFTDIVLFCFLGGIRQGECLSLFLFSIYLNDMETEFVQNGSKGVDIGMLKVFLLLYADDIVIFSPDENGLQKGLESSTQTKQLSG